jgi:hypothetical protein
MTKLIELLATYIFTAMASWVPISDHTYYEKPEITTVRYHEIANTIAEVALEPETKPIFEGDDGRIKTALILASIASSEGFFRQDVDNCKVGGDNNQAWGLWQTHASKKQVCSSRTVAAHIALDMIHTSFMECKNFKVMDRLSIYTDGKCHDNWGRSRYKMFRAMDYLSKHKLELNEPEEQYTAEHQ